MNKKRYIWEFNLTLKLFELNDKNVTWLTTQIEKHLINVDLTTKKIIIFNTMIQKLLAKKIIDSKSSKSIEIFTSFSTTTTSQRTQFYASSQSIFLNESVHETISFVTHEIILFVAHETILFVAHELVAHETLSSIAHENISRKISKQKRRKLTNIQLHDHLQVMIMSRFTSVNENDT
jgi:hypothetical protein